MVLIFNATGGWHVRWPWVLAAVPYATQGVRDTCAGFQDRGRASPGFLVVDSDIQDEAATNKDILRKAVKIGADAVVPKDFKDDVPRTVESAREFLRLHRDWAGAPADILFPLQWPYWECYNALQEMFLAEAFAPRPAWYGLGGLVGLSPATQLERIQVGVELLAAVGARIHLFGIYPAGDILAYIRARAGDIYSLDTTVCETYALTGRVIDVRQEEWDACPYLASEGAHKAGETRGRGTTRLKYLLAQYNLTVLDLVVNQPDLGARNPAARGGAPQRTKRPPKPAPKKPVGLFDKEWPSGMAR